MSKGQWVNTWNQSLAFSAIYSKSKPAEAVFWPGCSAMKLEPGLMRQTFKAMTEEIPGLGFSSWCCAKPTMAIGTVGQKANREEQLTEYFAANKIKRVYTLCPNCLQTLGSRTDVEVYSAWPILARYVEKQSFHASIFQERYIIHDPCASKNDPLSQQAARQILRQKGVNFDEFDCSGAMTRCCGRINMLFLTDPEASGKMLRDRLEKAGPLPILSYCESCVETFRGAGHPAYHLLEVVFDQKARRGIIHRITNTRGVTAYD